MVLKAVNLLVTLLMSLLHPKSKPLKYFKENGESVHFFMYCALTAYFLDLVWQFQRAAREIECQMIYYAGMIFLCLWTWQMLPESFIVRFPIFFVIHNYNEMPEFLERLPIFFRDLWRALVRIFTVSRNVSRRILLRILWFTRCGFLRRQVFEENEIIEH